VARETRKVMMKKAREMPRRSQTESAVPSSYSWNPTKPLMRRQTQRADVRPACTAAKYAYGSDPGGTTPESIHSDMKVSSM